MDLIKAIEEGQKRSFTTQFKVGDTVKVYFKIIEGKTERIQVYEGIVLCIKNAGARKTFTVRKESYGVGVERVFPVNSPRIVKVEIVRAGKVRRSKLYYLRDKIGKDKKVKEMLGGKVSAFINEQNKAAEAAAKKHTDDIVGELPKVEDQTQTVAQAIAAAEAAAKAYADQQVSGKNVTASGDDYVTAVAKNNHVTVTTNTSAIREAIFVWDGFDA